MQERRWGKVLYILMLLCVCLPWFTYDPKMMGYCWGWRFLAGLAVPLMGTGMAVFEKKRSAAIWFMAVICQLLNLAILVFALGRWQEFHNIRSGFQWADGLHTATAGYWAAVGVSLLLLAACVGYLMDSIKNRSVGNALI